MTKEFVERRKRYNPEYPDYIEQDRGYETPCWVWVRARTVDGYGKLRIARRDIMAHRFYYVLHRDELPSTMHIHHQCEIVECVNPWHLQAVEPAHHARIGSRLKLDYEAAESIRRMAERFHPSEIAAIYGVTQPHVYNILAGRKWAA